MQTVTRRSSMRCATTRRSASASASRWPAVLFLLNRKPRIQREADARLASIRRDKSDEYNKTRPLR